MQLEKPKLIWRFRSVEGHLQAVIGMVEQDQPCEQVICQLLAIRGSVDALLSFLIGQQVQRSLDVLACETCPEHRIAEINRLLSLYQLSSRHALLEVREL